MIKVLFNMCFPLKIVVSTFLHVRNMQNVHILIHKLFENLTLTALNMPILHIINHELSKNSPLKPTMKHVDTFCIHVL